MDKLNRNDFLYFTYTRLIKVYLLLIVLMGSFRIGFVAYFSEKSIYQEYLADLIYAFYMGLRYDTIVASYFLAVPFLLYLISTILKSRLLFNFISFLSGLYFLILFIFTAFILISDMGFYSFFQDHLNILFFGLLEDDTRALLISIWKNYPIEYALIGYLVFVFTMSYVLKKTFYFINPKQLSVLNPGAFKFVVMTSLGFVLLFGGARGGFGQLVLSPKYADFSKSLFVNQVSLNGLITFEKAIKLRRERTAFDFNMAKAMGYGHDIHQAFSDYLGLDVSPTSKEYLVNLLERKTPVNEKAESIKPHVIVLAMESFGSHWIQYNSEKFNFLGPLEKHFKDDILFNNFISSGNGTIGSLMVIGTNIPYRKGARFISESRYMQLPLKSSAHIPYKDSGYETSFVYGGKLGWRDIGQYFKYQKYHHIEGENHIRDSLQIDGDQGTEWGLYDEHFFNHILKKLKTAKRPQFILGLSTSNHPPFEMPESFKATALELPSELADKITREKDLFMQRFRAFQYANYKIAELIEKVKSSELADKTVIAITGDHNFWGFMNYEKSEAFSKYKVPFYLYLPKQLKPSFILQDRLGAHEDIMPTLYNLTLSEKPYLAFGEDLLGGAKTVAMNGDIYASDVGVIWKNKKYKWNKIPLINPSAISNPSQEFIELEKQVKSTLTVSDYFLRQAYKEYHKE